MRNEVTELKEKLEAFHYRMASAHDVLHIVANEKYSLQSEKITTEKKAIKQCS